MKALYKTQRELAIKIDEYFKSTDQPSIMEMRLYLKVSKQVIQNWKNNHQDYWDVYERAQTLILSKIEKALIYKEMDRGQVISYMFILKSYEREIFGDHAQQHETIQQQAPQIVIDMPKYIKGKQPNGNKKNKN